MFINFWYPAEQSQNISDTPLRLRMLGQDFVVWRDSKGEVHCLSNTCSHRGGSLSNGMVFCFLGDLPAAKRPPIMPIKEWDQEGWVLDPLPLVTS